MIQFEFLFFSTVTVIALLSAAVKSINHSVFPFVLALLVPISVILGCRQSGGGGSGGVAVGVCYVIVWSPMMDAALRLLGFVPQSSSSPVNLRSNMANEQHRRGSTTMLRLYVVLCSIAVFSSLQFASLRYAKLATALFHQQSSNDQQSGEFIALQQTTVFQIVVLAMSCGICCGAIGATVGHELLHRRATIDLLLSELQLLLFGYGHYFLSHRHHHLHVGTKADSVTARRDEWYHQFALRSALGSFTTAIHVENERLQRQQITGLRKLLQHRVLQSTAAYVIMVVLSCYFVSLSQSSSSSMDELERMFVFKCVFVGSISFMLAIALCGMMVKNNEIY